MSCGNRGRVKDERGQVLVFGVIVMVVLIAFTGFAIDVGHAYLAQRQLQAATDAAALAGAQELPDVSMARTVALQYGPNPGPGQPNAMRTVDNAVTDPPTVKCVQAVGCAARRGRSNAIQVKSSAVVPTFFAKIVGVNSFTVRASATACSPCNSKKFDVMIVLDRTGSMQGADLANAKNGVEQFLLEMDPSLDSVGLAIYPPAVNSSSACATPTNAAQRYGYNTRWPGWVAGAGTPGVYAVVRPSLSEPSANDRNYAIESPAGSGNWVLNRSARFLQTLACVQAGGTTTYANALAEAKHELKVNGRPDAQDVIVFFTDGAANTMPAHGLVPAVDGLTPLDLEAYGTEPSNGKPLRPCQAGVAAASWAKSQDGTAIYTIGYDVAGSNGGNCGDPGYTPTSTLRQMASDPGAYYEPRSGDNLGAVFEAIARDIQKPEGQLIDDSLS